MCSIIWKTIIDRYLTDLFDHCGQGDVSYLEKQTINNLAVNFRNNRILYKKINLSKMILVSIEKFISVVIIM